MESVNEFPTRILVTGGAGFIGGAFVQRMAQRGCPRIIVVDKLTYAADRSILQPWIDCGVVVLWNFDIVEVDRLLDLLRSEEVEAVVNFAAETHVDRSIDSPADFVHSNVVGTCSLLESAHVYWCGLAAQRQALFRYVQVSTDEVYGSSTEGRLFSEEDATNPSSPYAASKGAADQFVLAYQRTFGLPTMITRGSNTYGPRQFPEKMIPRMLSGMLEGTPLPLYGDGQQERDWIYVDDHCDAIERVLRRGNPGAIYNVSSELQCTNEELIRKLWAVLNEYGDLEIELLKIEHVQDRPGHDRRYAVCAERIREEIGWQVQTSLEIGLGLTVQWYLANPQWLSRGVDADGKHPRLGLKERGREVDGSVL